MIRSIPHCWQSANLKLVVAGFVSLCSFVFYIISLPYDAFHYGEYFVSRNFINGTGEFPITIHGALDYVPAILIYDLLSINVSAKQIIAFYYSLSSISICVFLLLIERFYKSYLSLIIIGIASVYMISYRDLFLMLEIFVAFKIFEKQTYFSAILISAFCGFLVFLGLFWSFDRGLIGMAFASTLVVSKNLPAKLKTSLSLTLTLCLISLFIFYGHTYFLEYAKNLLYLVKTSSSWSNYDVDLRAYAFAIVVLTLNLYVLIDLFFRFDFTNQRFPKSLIWGLVVVDFLMIKVSINRSDAVHAYMGLWVPLIISGIVSYYVQSCRLPNSIIFKLFSSSVLLISLFIFKNFVYPLAASICLRFPHPYEHLSTSTPKPISPQAIFLLFTSPIFIFLISMHAAKDKLDIGDAWVVHKLTEATATCITDFTNTGLISAYTNLPPCTKFTYLIYSTRDYQSTIIRDLVSKNQTVVVYSSESWQYKIDGLSMNTRYPMLNDYIIENYPVELCAYGRCLRYKEY